MTIMIERHLSKDIRKAAESGCGADASAFYCYIRYFTARAGTD